MQSIIRLRSSFVGLGRGFATGSKELLSQLKSKLESALEMARSVDMSAGQLMLETDPSNRQPRSFYVLRYLDFADVQLSSALEEVTAAEGELGTKTWRETLQTSRDLAILIAESRLARDQVQASIRYAL
ncbi:hypothetical protein Ndes2526B_g06263 [Nannochloris sp. 'desiccata']